MKRVGLFFFLLFTTTISWGQIASWDFTGAGSYVSLAATTFNANLSSSSNITRGAGAAASAGANSFRTTGFLNNGIATTNTDYFSITLGAATGFKVSLSTIDAFFNGTPSYCATPGVTAQFAYSLDGGTTITLIGAPFVLILPPAPATMTQINVSGVAALQNVASGTTITLYYYASGQTITGGWGFFSSSAGVNGLAIGGTVVAAATPAITLADNAPQITAANVSVGTTNVVLHQSSLAVITANATLTGMTCTTAGTYASADITNIKAWYSASSTFNSGTATLLSTFTTPGTAGAKTFPAFTSQTINSGTTGYIYITADVAVGATIGNTISVNALATANFTFSSGTKSGGTSAGGAQTFVAAVASSVYFVDEGFTAGPAALNAGFTTLTAGGVYTTASNFGRNSPSLSFTASGQIIQYGSWGGSADEISFLYMDESGAGSTFKVEESVTGAAWTIVTNSPATTITTAATFTASLLSTSRYIRITFTKVGNAMFDDLRIRKAGSVTVTNHINILEELINGGCGSCEGYNEFVYFESGDAPLDIHYLELVNPTMTYGLGDLAMGGNGTISSGAGGNNNTNINWIPNASLTGTQTAYTSALNTAAGCALFLNIPATNIIPPDSKVIAFTGCCPDAPYNFSGMCASIPNYGQVYVVYADENSGCTISGKYGNSCGGNCTRFLTLFNHGNGDNSNKSFTTPAGTSNGLAWDFVSNSSFASGCNSFVVLPVGLLSFTAEKAEDNIAIEWATATETNNNYFDVEYSLNGENFTFYTQVKGAGNSTNRKDYACNFTEDIGNAKPYFRLKQVDYNNNFKYSNIVSLSSTMELSSVNIYYNTDKDKIVTKFTLEEPAQVSISLYDITGREMYVSNNQFNEGDNQFVIAAPDVSGVYVLVYQSGSNSPIHKKVIVR